MTLPACHGLDFWSENGWEGAAISGLTFESLAALCGSELGVSDWMTVDQDMIDRFAECTGDRQWIHTDVERTRKESPFRKPIAHGYLTLSLISVMALEMDIAPEETQAAFIHGLDAVRFVSPVLAGSRVRMRVKLLALENTGPRQYLLRSANTVEIEGVERPALTAEVIVRLYEKRKKP